MIGRQFIGYAIIGLTLNLILYGAYLVLTSAGIPSLAAMTLTYAAGVLSGFVLNRSIIFRYRGGHSGALLRYVTTYGIGYAINFALLWLLAVREGLPHQVVQGGITLGLPVVLFALQKYWVFRARPARDARLPIRSLR